MLSGAEDGALRNRDDVPPKAHSVFFLEDARRGAKALTVTAVKDAVLEQQMLVT